MEMPESAKGIVFDPLLKVYGGCLIERRCHFYHRQENENCANGWSCYGCSHRTSCNRIIFERLAAYEMSKLSPETVMNYKIFEDEVISYGLTFEKILDIVRRENRKGDDDDETLHSTNQENK